MKVYQVTRPPRVRGSCKPSTPCTLAARCRQSSVIRKRRNHRQHRQDGQRLLTTLTILTIETLSLNETVRRTVRPNPQARTGLRTVGQLRAVPRLRHGLWTAPTRRPSSDRGAGPAGVLCLPRGRLPRGAGAGLADRPARKPLRRCRAQGAARQRPRRLRDGRGATGDHGHDRHRRRHPTGDGRRQWCWHPTRCCGPHPGLRHPDVRQGPVPVPVPRRAGQRTQDDHRDDPSCARCHRSGHHRGPRCPQRGRCQPRRRRACRSAASWAQRIQSLGASPGTTRGGNVSAAAPAVWFTPTR